MEIINVTDVLANNLSFDELGANTIQLTDVIKDLVVQLDNRIGIGLLVILSLYVLRVFVLKHYKKWLIQWVPNFKDLLTKTIDMLYNIIDYFALFFSIFIIYVWIQQIGFTLLYKIWIGFLTVAMILSIYLTRKEKLLN